MAGGHILAIDQGTTSSRAMVFDADFRPIAEARRELPQSFPANGWVEHDAETIWTDCLAVAREALGRAGLTADELAGIGITNQRETTVVWDRADGRPVHPAIVWQDRRTAEACRGLRESGRAAEITARTGLEIDPYFSATKLAWLLDNVPGLRSRAERGELAFGTIDSFLLFRLTGGRVHATDATNASRTMLMNLRSGDWDDDLLRIFDIPPALLPRIMDNAAEFGTTQPDLLGGPVPIRALVGDQQAALVGQGCLEPGLIKATYGTGCFILINCGAEPVPSANRLLTTVAYRLDGRATYALEGAIFVAGAAIQWLRDQLGLIDQAHQSRDLAATLKDNGGVYLVPAFTGLGAPHWDPAARGAILGLTRDTSAGHLVRAALEAQAYQTRDLLGAMAADWGGAPSAIRIDGGMAANSWMARFLADITGLPVERPTVIETTALGAAYLTGLQAGLIDSPAELERRRAVDRVFQTRMDRSEADALYAGWQRAVERVK